MCRAPAQALRSRHLFSLEFIVQTNQGILDICFSAEDTTATTRRKRRASRPEFSEHRPMRRKHPFGTGEAVQSFWSYRTRTIAAWYTQVVSLSEQVMRFPLDLWRF
jgi:hypothetical protein